MEGPSTPSRSGGGGGAGDGGDDGSGSTSSSPRRPPAPHDGDDNDARPPTHSPLWNRLVLSLLAMSLLWASSLRTAVFFTEFFVRIPPATFPLQVCRAAFDAVSAQASAYSACATRQLATCHADLDFAAEQERARAAAGEAANVLKLDAAEKLYSDCGTALTTSQAAILRWTQLSNTHEVPYVDTSSPDSTCSADDKLRAQVVLGDTSGSRSQVMASSAQYSKESMGTVRRMAEYTQALNAYNAEYFANKTQAIQAAALTMVAGINAPRLGSFNASFADVQLQLARLVACVAPGNIPNPQCPLPGLNARQRLDLLVAEMEGRFDGAAEGYQQWIDNYWAVASRAEAALKQFTDFYNGFADVIMDAGLRTTDFGSWFNVDWDVANVYPGELLDGVGIVFDMPPMPFTLDGIWDAVRPAVDLAISNVNLASFNTSLRALQWAQALETSLAALDVAPDDYNPPRYVGGNGEPTSVEAEVAAHDAMADTFVARTATSLDAFDSYNQYVDSSSSSTNVSQGNASIVLGGLPSFDFSFNLKYESLESPDIDVDALLRLFDRLPNLAFLTDYAYRIYGSLRILWKFRTQTALKLPTVDLRAGGLHSLSRGAEACLDFWQAVNPRRLLARLLASRYLPYLLAAGILLPLLLYGVLLYVAAYRDYQRGCVYNTNPRGSYAARATNSLAFNFAAYAGNQAMYDGLKGYNQRRAQYCADYGKASQGAQLNADRYLATMRAAWEEARAKVQLLGGCLDMPALDEAFGRGCCGSSDVPMVPFDSNSIATPGRYASCVDAGFPTPADNTACPVNTNYDPARPFPPLSASLGAPACGLDSGGDSVDPSPLWTLADGVFHCDVLPSCTPTCSGPHPELTQAWSRHCACTSEWALHAYVMAGSLAVLAYLLLNLARRLLLQAVAQARWRALFAGTLTVLAPCDLHGRLVICRTSVPASLWNRWRVGPLSPSRANARVAPSARPATAAEEEGEGEGADDDALIVRRQRQAKADGDGRGTPAPDAAGDSGGVGGGGGASSPVPAMQGRGGGGGGREGQQQQQEAFVRRRVEETMRAYEREAWAKGLLAVLLLVGAGLLISLAPQFLDYQP